MKKLKLYLDTSVISYLDQIDAPERMAETRLFWERIKAGKYDVVISDIVTTEIANSDEEKRKILTSYLADISYDFFSLDEQSFRIAEQFVDLHILKEKNIDDCRHIAGAIISGCDIIVSWNFKHIVNYKTQMGVKAVTALEGYKELLIYTPTVLLGGEDD